MGVRSAVQLVVSCISMLIWIYALGQGPVRFLQPPWYEPWYGSVALAIWTLIPPMFLYRGDRNGTAARGAALKKSSSVRITVNGRALEAPAEARTLLDWLREDLGLTAAKRGCSEGHCGSCTVLINGQAELSCRKPLAGLDGAEVLTLEGLARPGTLHPLQQAFIREGAIQCGFCTPGMILAAKALLDREPDPTDRQIARALAPNLCRCTGYVKILKAVRQAAEWLRQGKKSFPRAESMPEQPAPFGLPVPRVDALGKAAGELKFAEDLRFPGLLHAAVLRSEHPHARVLSTGCRRGPGSPRGGCGAHGAGRARSQRLRPLGGRPAGVRGGQGALRGGRAGRRGGRERGGGPGGLGTHPGAL